MTDREIRAQKNKEIRRKGGEKAVREQKAADAKKAAMKMSGMTAKGWDSLDAAQRKARETIVKWKETESRRPSPYSRPRLAPCSTAPLYNPSARRRGEPLITPRAGTRLSTFHCIMENVRKEIEKMPTNGRGAHADEAARKTDLFAKRKMREVLALFAVPRVDFETKVFCLDTAAILVGMVINGKGQPGKALREIVADSEDWQGYIRGMLKKLNDKDIKRLAEEDVEGTLFNEDLGDTNELLEEHKIWPDFKKNTVKYFTDRAAKVDPKTEPKTEPEGTQVTEDGKRRSCRKRSRT